MSLDSHLRDEWQTVAITSVTSVTEKDKRQTIFLPEFSSPLHLPPSTSRNICQAYISQPAKVFLAISNLRHQGASPRHTSTINLTSSFPSLVPLFCILAINIPRVPEVCVLFRCKDLQPPAPSIVALFEGSYPRLPYPTSAPNPRSHPSVDMAKCKLFCKVSSLLYLN